MKRKCPNKLTNNLRQQFTVNITLKLCVVHINKEQIFTRTRSDVIPAHFTHC